MRLSQNHDSATTRDKYVVDAANRTRAVVIVELGKERVRAEPAVNMVLTEKYAFVDLCIGRCLRGLIEVA